MQLPKGRKGEGRLRGAPTPPAIIPDNARIKQIESALARIPKCFSHYSALPFSANMIDQVNKTADLPLFDLTSSDLCRSGLAANMLSECWAGIAPESPKIPAAELGGAPPKLGWGIIGMGGAAWAGS